MWIVSLRPDLVTSLEWLPEWRQPVSVSGTRCVTGTDRYHPSEAVLVPSDDLDGATPQRMRSPLGAVFSRKPSLHAQDLDDMVIGLHTTDAIHRLKLVLAQGA